VNFIVNNPAQGGSLMAEASPSLNQAFGRYFLNAKFNSGHSEWSLGARYKMTEDIDMHRDYDETFTYPDGTSLTRVETPEGGSIQNSQGSAWLNYSYIKPDTTIVYASLNAWSRITDKSTFHGLLALSDGSEDIRLTEKSGTPGVTPSLSFYLEQHFAHKQLLVVDFESSLYIGRTFSDHTERIADTDELLNDIHTKIKDRNRAYSVEADYIKSWEQSRLTAGASYTANRNRSNYTTLADGIYHQEQDNVYVFTEYFRRLNKFTLTAGVGAQYNTFKFQETGQGNDSWNVRPQATVTYSPNSEHQLRLSFASWQSTPSLSETNVVEQRVDSLQWSVGNPNLKTASTYRLSLRYNYSRPRLDLTVGVMGWAQPDAITEYLYWDEAGRLMTTYENSRGLQRVSPSLSVQVEVIPSWLSLSGTLQYAAERQKGTGYTHYNHNWSGSASASLTHWGCSLNATYERAERSLDGEKLSWGEDDTFIDLNYDWRDWTFGAGIFMPFGTYDQGSKLLSQWNQNEMHLRLDMRIPYLTVAYHVQWGRRNKGVDKIISTDSNVQQSRAASR
jgi:hypothetical protein